MKCKRPGLCRVAAQTTLTMPHCGVNLPRSGKTLRTPSTITRRDPMATQPLRTQVKKQLDDVTSEVTKSAHQVFLAGLGAAALSQEEGGRLFDRLVTRGRKVEA